MPAKRSSSRRNLETPALRCVWTENILKTEAIESDNVTTIV